MRNSHVLTRLMCYTGQLVSACLEAMINGSHVPKGVMRLAMSRGATSVAPLESGNHPSLPFAERACKRTVHQPMPTMPTRPMSPSASPTEASGVMV
jgi:hypothetical protein